MGVTFYNCIFKMAISNKPAVCAFLVYPDESDKRGLKEYTNIKKVFDINGLNGFVSPLHDEDGKTHIHILVIRPSRCGFSMSTWREIAQLFRAANNHVEVIHSPHKYARYLLHKNPEDLEKQQFTWQQIRTFGYTFKEYRQYCKQEDAISKIKDDENYVITDIIKYIKKEKITYYSVLVDYCVSKNKNWLPLVISKHNFFLQYIRSLEYLNNDFIQDFK